MWKDWTNHIDIISQFQRVEPENGTSVPNKILRDFFPAILPKLPKWNIDAADWNLGYRS